MYAKVFVKVNDVRRTIRTKVKIECDMSRRFAEREPRAYMPILWVFLPHGEIAWQFRLQRLSRV